MTNNQKQYKEFCEKIDYIPIFLEWWWINTVTNGSWDVVFSFTKDNKVKGAMPYYAIRPVKFLSLIKMPKQTQVMGCWLNYPKNQKLTTKLSFEKEVMTDLIGKIPRSDYYMQRFHYSIVNWLPFFWEGYKQTTQYTYVLSSIKNHDVIFSRLRSNIRTDIRKAQKVIVVLSNNSVEEFYKINKLTFDRQSRDIPYSLDFLTKIHRELVKRNKGKIYFAMDDNQNIHATIYVIWDDQSAYYMWGGGNPEFRNSGAMSLLLWTAIQECSAFVDKFDFEGSMIEPVERFVRSFGAEQVPYNKIYKFNSKLMEFLYLLKSWKK